MAPPSGSVVPFVLVVTTDAYTSVFLWIFTCGQRELIFVCESREDSIFQATILSIRVLHCCGLLQSVVQQRLFKPRSRWKMTSTTVLQHTVLFDALNDKSVAGLLDLIPVCLPRPQYPQCVRVWSTIAVTAVGANFDHIYFTKYCSSTLEMWWDLYWSLYCKFPRECASERISKIGQGKGILRRRLWSLVSPFLLTHGVVIFNTSSGIEYILL